MSYQTKSQNIEQQRAAMALKLIENNISNDRLKAYAQSLPAMILSNGFGQAMAFIKAKGGSKKLTEKDKDQSSRAYQQLYQSIQDWLINQGIVEPHSSNQQKNDLVIAITGMSQANYQIASRETMAYLQMD